MTEVVSGQVFLVTLVARRASFFPADRRRSDGRAGRGGWRDVPAMPDKGQALVTSGVRGGSAVVGAGGDGGRRDAPDGRRRMPVMFAFARRASRPGLTPGG
jgi:hypothetical protein